MGPLRERLVNSCKLKFTTRNLASEGELRIVAREFSPDIVLSVDTACAPFSQAFAQLLTLLSREAPHVLVCEVDGNDAMWRSKRPIPRLLERTPASPALDAPQLARMPSVFEHGTDAAVLVDLNGWIREANPRATALLCKPRAPRLAGAAVHVEDLILRVVNNSTAGRPCLPLAALNLDGIELLRAAHPILGEMIFEMFSEVVQPRYARCGLMMQTCAQEYLLVLPAASSAPDAACAALGPPLSLETASSSAWEAPPGAYGSVPVLTEVASGTAPTIRWPQGASSMTCTDFEHGIEREALSVHYQPQFDMHGQGCGVEALARWTLSNGQSLPPCVFIPVAERSGLIGALGASILQTACDTAASWRGREVERLTLSVNVSAQQIDSRYCRVLETILKGSGFPALRLELEVAETALLNEREATMNCLRQWKQLGVRIAVNHFGTDYSSLSYLARLCVDRLKLDKSLIHRMGQERKIAAVVHAVIALGAELNIEVMAEGVETEAQLSMLRDLGCTHAQGFLLARPMPAAQAQIALRKRWGNLPLAAHAAASEPARAH